MENQFAQSLFYSIYSVSWAAASETASCLFPKRATAMKIGIISDTHDQRARTSRAVARLMAEGAQALIHCGDLTQPDIVHECAALPSYFVFGNNDYDEVGLRAAMAEVRGVCLERGGEIVLAGKRLAVTHGDSAREARRLLATVPDYFLFGHTHVPHDGEGTPRCINPGALHRAARWTVALLDLDADVLEFFDVL